MKSDVCCGIVGIAGTASAYFVSLDSPQDFQLTFNYQGMMMNKENTLSMNPSFLVSGGVFLFIFALVHFLFAVSFAPRPKKSWQRLAQRPILFLGYS